MPNRQLTKNEIETIYKPLMNDLRLRIKAASGEDSDLLWALRRKLAKQLIYDERKTPMQRRALKKHKRLEQNNKSAECGCELPDKDVILDRLEVMNGYSPENTRLLCRPCDFKIQTSRGFA